VFVTFALLTALDLSVTLIPQPPVAVSDRRTLQLVP
jgi:hypothetical protein